MGRDIEVTPEKTLVVSTVAELEGLLPLLKACERDQPIADVRIQCIKQPIIVQIANHRPDSLRRFTPNLASPTSDCYL